MAVATLSRPVLEDEAIDALRSEIERKGRTISITDWTDTGLEPEADEIVRCCGSWAAAVWAATHESQWSPGDVVTQLKTIAETLGRAPTRVEWNDDKTRRPRAKTVQRIFGSWDDALRAAGLETIKRPDAEIFEAAHELARKLGRPPAPRDWHRANMKPTYAPLRQRFGPGGWKAFLSAAGFSEEEVANVRLYRRWSREMMVEALHRVAGDLGRTPGKNWWIRQKPEDAPSYDVIRYEFGTWTEFQNAAGLKPGAPYRPRPLPQSKQPRAG